MTGNSGRAAWSAALLVLIALGAVLLNAGSAAQAGTIVTGSVSVGLPIGVLGFSYGNPYQYGPVYSDPSDCPDGPIYYYPSYRVYAPYYPGFSYQYYPRPRYYPRYHPSYGYRQVVPYGPPRGYAYRYGGPSYGHGYASGYGSVDGRGYRSGYRGGYRYGDGHGSGRGDGGDRGMSHGDGHGNGHGRGYAHHDGR